MSGIFFDLLPQMADVDAQTVFISVIIGTPDGFAQCIVGDNMAAVFSQLAQQRQFCGGEGKDTPIRSCDQGVL